MTLAVKQTPSASAAALAVLTAGHRRKGVIAVAALVGLCLLLMLLSLGAGAFAIAPGRVADILLAKLGFGAADMLDSREALVVLNIRMPRLLLGALVGAALAISGALMQGLFRNPLADPGLVGVSAGAGLAAAATIVLGDRIFLSAFAMKLPFAVLPFGAFFGGLVSTLALYLIATRQGRTSVATMLLAGVALGALAGSLTGLLAFISDDRQLRDLTFWSLGSLGGASWTKLSVVAPIVLPLLFAVPLLARGLNALMLGEAEAYHLGIPVQRIKALAILLVALAVGASVAAAGVIGFVGIVVPHLIRLSIGPDHRLLLPLSAIGGAALLVGADIIARLVVVPAELPIGIVTAFIGAPFFLWLLLRRGRIAEL
jgi:iron complex transport system permease protein